jgi:Flp pilus assembly protein TadG
MGRTRRRRRAEEGAAAVEFALVALPLFVLLFGILQYGILLFQVQGAAATVKDAAEWAAVGITDCDTWEDRAATRLAAFGVPGGLSPVFTAGSTYSDSGPDVVEVTVTFSPQQIVPLIPVPTTVERTAQYDIQDRPPGSVASCP